MTFDEWAREYFGDNVDVPEACRDAWNVATRGEREACAKLCDAEADWEPEIPKLAAAIRERSNAPELTRAEGVGVE